MYLYALTNTCAQATTQQSWNSATETSTSGLAEVQWQTQKEELLPVRVRQRGNQQTGGIKLGAGCILKGDHPQKCALLCISLVLLILCMTHRLDFWLNFKDNPHPTYTPSDFGVSRLKAWGMRRFLKDVFSLYVNSGNCLTNHHIRLFIVILLIKKYVSQFSHMYGHRWLSLYYNAWFLVF